MNFLNLKTSAAKFFFSPRLKAQTHQPKKQATGGLLSACFVVAIVLLQANCATREILPTGLNIMSESQYRSTVDEFSDSTERYSGLYNTITMRSTLLNSKVLLAEVDQNARQYQWDAGKYQEEQNKASERLNKETEVFVSFFTPIRKHDNLHRSKTLWKIFLDVDGKRYEGKATKIKLLVSEIQSLYPYHTGFSSPYSVVFPVSVRKFEKSNSKMTVTGPVGSASVNFPAITN